MYPGSRVFPGSRVVPGRRDNMVSQNKTKGLILGLLCQIYPGLRALLLGRALSADCLKAMGFQRLILIAKPGYPVLS